MTKIFKTKTVIRKIFLNILPSFLLSIFLIFAFPTISTASSINISSTLNSNMLFATLKYEQKEPTTLANPVTDPNFNVMRNKELGKSFAIPLVVGVLIIAISAPLVTWWYFSK